MLVQKNKLKNIAEIHCDVLNGTPVFKGTRVSVPLVLEYLSKGWTIKDLEKSYPSVKSEYISYLLHVYSESLSQWNEKNQ